MGRLAGGGEASAEDLEVPRTARPSEQGLKRPGLLARIGAILEGQLQQL